MALREMGGGVGILWEWDGIEASIGGKAESRFSIDSIRHDLWFYDVALDCVWMERYRE